MNATIPTGTTVLVSRLMRSRASHDASVASRQPSRVARMLALAHHLQRAIDAGIASDRATVARAFGHSRARISQILDLLLLAPDIQEKVLASEAVDSIEPFRERDLRAISHLRSWAAQRQCFARKIGAPSIALSTVPRSPAVPPLDAPSQAHALVSGSASAS